MKKPYLNQTQRKIIIENESIYASQLKIDISKKKIQRYFVKTILGLFMVKMTIYLNDLLNGKYDKPTTNTNRKRPNG